MKCQQCGKVMAVGEIEVVATHFKRNGTYYSGGCVHVQKFEPPPAIKMSGRLKQKGEPRLLGEIYDEVIKQIEEGCSPGLVSGPPRFFTQLRCPHHPHDHPKLYYPEAWVKPEEDAA